MEKYLDWKNTSTKKDWRILEELTYALFNATIKREKDDIANPMTIMPLKTAITYSLENTQIDDAVAEALREEGMLITKAKNVKKQI